MATAFGVYIGKRIAQARREEGLATQQALADLLPSPINNQYVSKWEGGVKPKDETLELIAAALNRSTSWFYEGFQKAAGTPDPFAAASSDHAVASRLERIEGALGDLLAARDGANQRQEDFELLAAQLATRDAEVLSRIEEVHRAIQDLQGQPPR